MAFGDSSCAQFFKNYYRMFIVLLLPVVLLPLPIMTTMEGRGLYILIIMAVFWITEAVPLGVTSLLPLVLGPLLSIMKAADIAPNYFKDVIVLFYGGLMVALCIERWHLHKRIALGVMLIAGTQKRWLMLGIMVATWFLSMWVSNTATTAMMVPIVAAIVDAIPDAGASPSTDQEEEEEEETGVKNGAEEGDVENNVRHESQIELKPTDPEATVGDEKPAQIKPVQKSAEYKNMRKGFYLCIAYAAACGGVATLTGTPPNLVLIGVLEKTYGENATRQISFSMWMAFGVPLSVVTLILVWLWLCIFFFGFRDTFLGCRSDGTSNVRKTVLKQFKAMGPMSWPEAITLILFLFLVSLWLTRTSQQFTGWGTFFGDGSYVTDSTAAMLIAFLMMILPSAPPTFPGKEYKPLLEWSYVAANFPFAIVLLLGGGYALADLCKASGITDMVVNQLSTLRGVPVGVVILVVSALVAGMTEIASNTAMSNLVLPLMSTLAVHLDLNPMMLMLPATIAASFAFMLPTATPPNAVVFSHGVVTVFDMIKAGFVLNIICILVLQAAVHTVGVAVFDLNSFPAWANQTGP